MQIKPHRKLLVKQWLILLSVSLGLVLAAILLQFIVPLMGGATFRQVTAVLWPITFGLILIMWAIAAPIVALWIRNLAYVIEEDRITIHKGILTKIQQNIPYRAITDFMLHRSLYDRFLGIGAIRIQTAGQSQTVTGYEGQLAGLMQWDDLLQQLREKVRNLHPLAEAIAVAEPATQQVSEDRLQQILLELQSIRKMLENAVRQRGS
ncbi:MAG: PH domain-containing protein [Fidelibacterota bacterium]|nr:MAG: PH domain-containing protein [Candidatus Neomarinimicrobiota bacterium]